MSYQPKSYRKFLAGSVSAAMVATTFGAVAPVQVQTADAAEGFSDIDNNHWAAGSIERLADKGIIGGYEEDNTYRASQYINRGQVAKMLVSAFDLEVDENVAPPFEDLSEESYFKPYAAAVKEEGYIRGRENNTQFAAGMDLSREQMATILVRAFELEATEGEEAVVNDLEDADDSHKNNIEILAQYGITSTEDGNFRPKESVTRAQFAVFLERALAVDFSLQEGITSVSAVNENTVEVTFNRELSEEEVSAENFSFDPSLEVVDAEVTASSETETTVQLTTAEQDADAQYDFYFKGELTSYDVNGSAGLEVNSVSGLTLAVDENTDEQFLTFGMNGSNNEVSVDTLVEAGYDVEFQSTDTSVLEDASTGELNEENLTAGESFEYKVVVTKDDVTVESELQEVNVESYASIVTSVSEYDLLFDGNVVNESGVISVADSDVALDNFDVTYKNGDKATINGTSSQVDFSSSDESVALIDEDGVITPVAAGEVTFTIEAGEVKEEITVTVSGETRVAASAELSKETIGLVSGVEDTFELTVKDQFGDAVKGFNEALLHVENSDEEEILAVTNGPNDSAADEEGKTTVTVQADAANEGTGTLEVKNSAGDVIGTIDVTVDADTEFATRELELDSDSDDTTLDLNPLDSDDTLTVVLNEYNESGLKIGGYDFSGDFTYESSNTDVITVEDTNDGSDGKIDVTAVSEGTAKVVVKEGSVVQYELEITVEDSTPSIANVSFQEDVEITSEGTLNLEEDIIDAVALTSEGTVAYEESNGDVVVYVDVNDDNNYTEADDITLGTIDVLSNDFENAQFVNANGDIELAKNYEAETITGFESDDEGTVVVRLTAEGESSAKAARSINVDVE